MAGHADPATTSRYDRRDKRARHRAAALLHLPYRRRTFGTEEEAKSLTWEEWEALAYDLEEEWRSLALVMTNTTVDTQINVVVLLREQRIILKE